MYVCMYMYMFVCVFGLHDKSVIHYQMSVLYLCYLSVYKCQVALKEYKIEPKSGLVWEITQWQLTRMSVG